MHGHTRGIAADVQRFFVPVELDRQRVLAFDNRAAFRVYQRYGASFWRELYEPNPEKEGTFRLRSQEAFEFFLWAGLQRDAEAAGEDLSLEAVRDLILPESIADLAAALLVALSATRRRPAKAAKGNDE